jgi:hypothetical protein
MTEFYAKIVPMETGSFRFLSTIWKSENGIESIWNTKKFFTCGGARRWSIRKIVGAVSRQSETLFIKESDIIRRKWND